MNDVISTGSAAAGNPLGERLDTSGTGSAEAGNPGRTPHHGETGNDASAMASYLDGLSQDNRLVAETKGWDDPNQIIQSYGELESRLGKTLNVPDEGASAEDWDRLYARLGRPDSAEGYAFDLPENLPEDFPYDGESAQAFASWAHEAGLNPHQAQSLHDRFVHHQAETLDDMNAVNARREGDAFKALIGTWGAEDSEVFARKTAMAAAAMRDAGEAGEALTSAGLMAPDGGVRDARLAIWLSKLGERFFTEDSLDGGAAMNWSGNPFAGETLNATEQAKLIRSDPETAIAYMRAAGLAPGDPQMQQARRNTQG